eukprot:gene36972-44852_t
MNNFLRINERITTIRNMLHLHHPVQMGGGGAESKREEERLPVTVTPAATASNARYHDESDPFGLMSSRAAAAQSGAGSTAASMQRGQVVDITPPRKQEEEEVEVWSSDQAEEIKEMKQVPPMDEDQLGRFEEDVRSLMNLMQNSRPKELLRPNSEARQGIRSVTKRWPALRATSVVGVGVDFSLIPRAMQVEEDLVRLINEFRNLETIKKMV